MEESDEVVAVLRADPERPQEKMYFSGLEAKEEMISRMISAQNV